MNNLGSVPVQKLARLTRKVHLAGTWMSEKSFAATPYSCRDKMLDPHIIMQGSVENFIMASQ